ncbi:rCG42156 [Rattus norvegicus]|uniref:RCG42156 n=1 Tax=Rattus norvegicus TaxID=10116 RepID=A6K028_RAT|nr:rCG42156 [Rattus norvegicus]
MLQRMQRKRNTPPLLWDCKLVQLLWKSVWSLLRKFDIVLREDPAIPLLAYMQKMPQHITRTHAPLCS